MGGPDALPQRISHMWKVSVDNSPATTEAPGLTTIWSEAAERIRQEVTPGTYDMWFAELRPRELNEELLEIGASSDYVRSWVQARHLGLITRMVSEAAGRDLDVRIVVEERTATKDRLEIDAPRPPDPAARQLPPALPTKYTFDTFVLGPSNRFAHAAAMAVAEAPPSKAYNPLFIYGGVGLGKTHLLYAIANHMTRLIPGLRVTYVTSEAFVTEFIRAIRDRQGYQFQRRYRDVDVLLIDDIQFLAGKEETQTEFFHTFNALHGAESQIVVVSDRPPQELSGLEERLRNRFRWGLCVDVQPPDLETRIAILQKKAFRDHMDVPDDVMHFIADKFDSNIRELEGALLRVGAFASLSNKSIDLALTQRGLEGLLPQSGQEIPPELILEATARYFGFRREDLSSKSRSRPLTNARHIAMYLLRELSPLSLIKIGELLDRDHSTALHGINRILKLMPERGSMYTQVQELTKNIQSESRGIR